MERLRSTVRNEAKQRSQISLNDIIKRAFASGVDPHRLDSYVMQHESDSNYSGYDDSGSNSRTIIVKRMSLTLNNKECQVLNFIDITPYQKLKDSEEKSAQLSALNSQVSNQIIGPLHVNAEVIKRMLTIFEKNRFPHKLREMAQTVLIASNQAMSLANDLLDQEFIKKG